MTTHSLKRQSLIFKIAVKLNIVVTILLIPLWLYASGTKLLDHKNFRFEIALSPLLTNQAEAIAWIIPIVEVIIAVILIGSLEWPKYRSSALYASLGLLLVFSIYIIAILNFSEYIPCSCAGILGMSWIQHLYFNLFALLLVFVALIPGSIEINRDEENT